MVLACICICQSNQRLEIGQVNASVDLNIKELGQFSLSISWKMNIKFRQGIHELLPGNCPLRATVRSLPLLCSKVLRQPLLETGQPTPERFKGGEKWMSLIVHS